MDEIKPKAAGSPHAAARGEISRILLAAFHEAQTPPDARDLTIRLMKAWCMDPADRNLFLTMQKRVLASVRNLRIREVLRPLTQEGRNLRWVLAEKDAFL